LVDVQVRAHHIVDVVDRQASGRETLLEAVAVHHVPERPRRPRFVIADTGIDQDVVGAPVLMRKPCTHSTSRPLTGSMNVGSSQEAVLLEKLFGERGEEFHDVEERRLLARRPDKS